MNDLCDTSAAKKPPISAELMGRARNLSERAHDVAQRVAGKLEPVMRQQEPQNEKCGSEVQEQYPPLFEDYRSSLGEIENALAIIDNCLRRCEL